MSTSNRLVLVLAALGVVPAFASSITVGAFVVPVVTTFDGLGLPFLNNTPMVIGGTSIDTSTQTMRYLTSATCSNECLGTDEDTGTLTIVFPDYSARAGVWVGLSAADVHFFDPSHAEVGVVSVAGNSASAVFAGWDAGLGTIASLQVVDTEANGHIVTVEDLTLEATPEPSTLLMLAGAFSVFPIVRRRYFYKD